MFAAALQELEEWARGLFGDRLSRAMSYVRGAKQSGEVGTKVQPQVQAFGTTVDALRLATNAYVAKAAPLAKDNPDVAERIDRMVAAYRVLYERFHSPESARKATKLDETLARTEGIIGIAATTAVLVIITVAGVTYAVSELGSAYAIAAQGDAEQALAQVRLQTKELDERVAATKDGRTLPPSTLPQPNPNPSVGSQVSTGVKVAAGVAAAALATAAVVSLWPSGKK